MLVFLLIIFFLFRVCVCVWGGNTCHSVHVEVRGHLVRTDSLFPPCGAQELSQTLLPAEPEPPPQFFISILPWNLKNYVWFWLQLPMQ